MGSKIVHSKNKHKYEEARKLRRMGVLTDKIAQQLNIARNTISRWTADIGMPHPRYRTDGIDHSYFSAGNLRKHPERAVIIGFIAADGCVHFRGNHHILAFNLCRKDKVVLDIINKEVCSGCRKISEIKSTVSNTLQIPSHQICSDLSKFNIIPRKTATYDLPNLKEPLMAYFLRGYFYGDGTFYDAGKNSLFSIIGTQKFTKHLRAYLIDNEILDTCRTYPLRKGSEYSKLHVRGRIQVEKFKQYLFDDKMVLLDRKHLI